MLGFKELFFYVRAQFLKFKAIAGRPPTKPKTLRNGFYLEVRNPGSASGIKLRRDTRDEMNQAAEEYSKTKEVIILGEVKSGKFIDGKNSKKK